METMSVTSREHVGLRNTSRGIVDDVRTFGGELIRQRRLRMDVFQTERRLKSAYSNLGEAVFKDLSELKNVDLNDGRVIEIIAHIRYYHDELARLKSEMRAGSEVF